MSAPALYLASTLAITAVLGAEAAAAFDWIGLVELEAEGLRSDNAATRDRAVQQLSQYDIHLTESYLLTALEDPALEVRLDAARALGVGRSERAVPTLIEWLGDAETKIRIAAADALGAIGGPAARSALTRSLGDADHAVRQRAVHALGGIGRRGDASVVIALLPRLSDDKADVRRETVQQLEAIADRRAVIPLVAAFSDNHPEVRKAAVRAVGRFADASVVPALLRLLRDPTEEVRSAAVSSLGQIGSASAIGALSDLLSSGTDVFRSKVAYSLGQIARDPSAGKAGEAALQSLVSALATPSLRNAAREALRASGSAAIPALLLHLTGKLPGDPTTAVGLLGDAADARATAVLAAELERRRVAPTLVLDALGATGDPDALVPVLSTLSSKDPAIRLAAMNAMRPLLGDDGRASDVLIERLDDPELEVRIRAAEYLGLVRARQGTEKLLAVLAASPPLRLRHAIVDALGAIGDARALPALLDVLRAGPPSLRPAAATALTYLASPEAIEPLARLLALPPENPPLVLRALGGSLRALRVAPGEPRPRVPAVTAVTAVLEELARLAREGATSTAVAAIGALSAAGDLAVAPALRHVATRGAPDRRRAALLALAELGDPQALSLALEALQIKDDRVAADAAWAATLVVRARPSADVPVESSWDRLAFAAKHGRWATAISASAGLSALAPRLGAALDAERRAALHLLSFHHSPLVRCNVGQTLAALGAGLDARLRADLLRLLVDDSNTRVRATLAGALRRLSKDAPLDGELAAGLAKLADDPSELVRVAASRPARAAAAPAGWRIFEVVDADADDAPMRHQPYFVQDGDGLVRGVYSDANGEISSESLVGESPDVLPATRESEL